MTLTDKEQARLDELIRKQGQEFTGAERDELKALQTKKATVLQNTAAREADEKVKADKVIADDKVEADRKAAADKVEADRKAKELEDEENAKTKRTLGLGDLGV